MNNINSQAEILNQFFDAFTKQAISFADSVSPHVLKIGAASAEAGQKIHDLFYREYLKQGAIYGETNEGFQRWADEIGEIHRLEARVRELRDRHQMLISFR